MHKFIIMSSHFNTIEYIKFQYLSLKKFITNEYEFIVINDSKDKKCYTNYNNDNLNIDITNICKFYNIECINFNQNDHINRQILYPYEINDDFKEIKNNPNSRCADVTQFMLNLFNKKYSSLDNNILIILDSDMFFVQNINLESIIEDYDIVAIQQSRKNNVKYLWNGIVIINPKKLKNLNEMNWNCGFVNSEPTDVGGYTHFYIEKYKPNIKYINYNIYSYPETVIKSNSLPLNIKNFFLDICKIKKNNSCNKEYIANSIIHLRGGGNWDHQGIDTMDKQNKLIYEYFFK